MESDYSDDEYAPISLGAWGDQGQQQETATAPSSEDSPESGIKDWAQLIDPATKASPGTLGSGGLHRTGKNYKPIDEEHILKQRMKGGPLPKSNNNNNKTRGNRSNDSSKKGQRNAQKPKLTTFSKKRTTTAEPPPKSTPTTKQASARQRPQPPSTIRRPPPSSGNSGWGAPLVETPFWEKQKKSNTQSSTNSASTAWSNAGERNTTDSSQQVPDSWASPAPPPAPPTQKKTVMPPPGFGNIPRRQQYPVATGKPQAPPPPGFSYVKRPTTPPPSSSPPPQQQQQSGSKLAGNGVGLDWDDKGAKHGSGSKGQPTPSTQANDGWGSESGKWAHANFMGGTNTTSSSAAKQTNGSNGKPTPPAQDNGGWGSESNKWTSANFMGSDNTSSSSPAQFVDEHTTALKSGRFSDPYKSRYSSGSQDTGLPKNYYRKDGVSRPAFMQTPSRIAAPPPSHNPVVVSVHLELENGSKVPIAIRKLDDPTLLARSFCHAQNISNPVLINGITQLFVQQQQVALQRYTSSK